MSIQGIGPVGDQDSQPMNFTPVDLVKNVLMQ